MYVVLVKTLGEYELFTFPDGNKAEQFFTNKVYETYLAEHGEPMSEKKLRLYRDNGLYVPNVMYYETDGSEIVIINDDHVHSMSNTTI